jgi:hypothetical protein
LATEKINQMPIIRWSLWKLESQRGFTTFQSAMKIRKIVWSTSLGMVVIPLTQPVAAETWQKRIVTKDFLTEGLSAGDLDGDGLKDLVAGAFWFKGPDFGEAKAYRPGKALPAKVYQEDSFLSWVDDLNGDGRNDILMASHPGKDLTLYLNPGKEGDWPAHRVMSEAASESPLWIDLNGDGKGEFVCMQGGKFGFATVNRTDVTQPWQFTAISEKRTDTPYVHGLGVGDLSGDGKPDIVAKDGWFEQPAALTATWKWHPVPFATAGGAQMLVFDADGDGDNDVITSLNGHGYGLAWYSASRDNGNITFTRHDILPEDPTQKSTDGLQFSQLHALEKGDFDNDGRIDFITGKRYYAHNGHDPGAEEPAVAVIFYNRKEDDGIRWQAEAIDAESGVGCQVLAVDLDGDGKLDFAAGSKKGVHVISR